MIHRPMTLRRKMRGGSVCGSSDAASVRTPDQPALPLQRKSGLYVCVYLNLVSVMSMFASVYLSIHLFTHSSIDSCVPPTNTAFEDTHAHTRTRAHTHTHIHTECREIAVHSEEESLLSGANPISWRIEASAIARESTRVCVYSACLGSTPLFNSTP